MRRRALPILTALAAAGLAAWLLFSRAELRTDMADFLPGGQTEAARFMLRELRSGTAASLILLGIEGAPTAELARVCGEGAAGLGLAICRRVIERHGGRIWITAGPEGGADVRFTLPAPA